MDEATSFYRLRPPKRHGIRGQKLKILRPRIYLTSRIRPFPPYIFLSYQKHRLITFINRSSVTTLPSPRRRISNVRASCCFKSDYCAENKTCSLNKDLRQNSTQQRRLSDSFDKEKSSSVFTFLLRLSKVNSLFKWGHI